MTQDRTERPNRLCRRLAADVAAIAPAGLDTWDRAWEATGDERAVAALSAAPWLRVNVVPAPPLVSASPKALASAPRASDPHRTSPPSNTFSAAMASRIRCPKRAPFSVPPAPVTRFGSTTPSPSQSRSPSSCTMRPFPA